MSFFQTRNNYVRSLYEIIIKGEIAVNPVDTLDTNFYDEHVHPMNQTILFICKFFQFAY